MSAVRKPSPLSKSTNSHLKSKCRIKPLYGKGLENLSDHDLYLLSVSLFDEYMECESNVDNVTTILDVYGEMQKRGLPMVQKI